jgi:hypothetical protein
MLRLNWPIGENNARRSESGKNNAANNTAMPLCGGARSGGCSATWMVKLKHETDRCMNPYMKTYIRYFADSNTVLLENTRDPVCGKRGRDWKAQQGQPGIPSVPR